MADNSSSVAVVAIVIIVILAGVVAYYFINKEGLNANGVAPSKVEVNMPASTNSSH